jgi:hypothetical protein
MHAVSLTPRAKYDMHHMHDRRTIRAALAAFKCNIYILKNVCVRELFYHTTKNIYI